MKTIHGFARRGHKSPEYLIWISMHQRCENPKNKQFHRYGGRGISVSNRWDDFQNFIDDMGPRPTIRHSLDRYPNNDGNYEPGNCRWATSQEQALNTRRNIWVIFRGKRMRISDAAAMAGLKYGTVINRIRRGATPEDALIPVVVNPGAKLDKRQILAIRADHRPQWKIALDYRVSRSNIGLIKSNKTWSVV